MPSLAVALAEGNVPSINTYVLRMDTDGWTAQLERDSTAFIVPEY